MLRTVRFIHRKNNYNVRKIVNTFNNSHNYSLLNRQREGLNYFRRNGGILSYSSAADGSKSGGNAPPENSIIQSTLEPEGPKWEVMSTGQKIKETSKTGLYLGIAGLVVTCGYLMIKELMPTKLSANTIFSHAFDACKEHPDVTMRLGRPLKAFGHDHGGRREGRRNFVDKDEFKDQKGNDVVRIKFAVEGPRGKGIIYAARSSNLHRNDFLYLIFHCESEGRSYALIDNRKEETLEEEQLKMANALVNLGAVMYGSEQNDDTQRQKMEFGEFFDRIKYLQCDKHGLDKEGDDTCDKLQRRYPAWKFDDRVYVGVVTRDKMAQLLKQENEYAKAKKKSLLQ
jgi:hypothetical protein